MSQLVVETNVAVVRPRDIETSDVPAPSEPLRVRCFGMTDAGKVRPTNQDQFLIASLRKALHVLGTSLPMPRQQDSGDQCQLFVVADGMGGHAGGEHASALAIDSVDSFVLHTFRWFAHLSSSTENDLLADFKNALGQANARILAEAAQHPELGGMGTTLTLAYRLNDRLFVAHVGDSRCYLLRQRRLYRLTKDHTLMEEMIRQGMLSPEEAAKHQWRHVITNAVGADTPDVMVEVHRLQLEPGDTLSLCSDGLTNMVSDDALARILVDAPDPESACRQCIQQANENGGRDNITVIVARFETT